MLIAGGSGFLGGALSRSMLAEGHRVFVLTRRAGEAALAGIEYLKWDGMTTAGWGSVVNDVDAIVNLCGESLASWPWTAAKKRTFIRSRVLPGRALMEAVTDSKTRPRVFVQGSGINYYGLDGDIADEASKPGEDFLSQVTIEAENATMPVKALGVRHAATRSGIVLARRGGLLPLLSLSTRLFAGGPMGNGHQAMNWIHIDDQLGAMRAILENESAHGPFNLIAPVPTTNRQFMRALAAALRRPFWLSMPEWALRLFVGEMRNLVVKGRLATPRKLVELGYRFRWERLDEALKALFD